METHCLRLDQLPGTSRLMFDYSYQFQRVDVFYRHAPYDPDSLLRAAEAIRYPGERRHQIADALEALNPGSPLIAKLRMPGTVVVATGQQVGYLGGPAYTVYKALTAIHVAAQLESRGVSAVPVFWLASEDHDLDEVDHAWVFDGQRQPARVEGNTAPRGNAPVGNLPAPKVEAAALQALFGHLPFAAEVAAMAAAAYDGAHTYSSAFQQLVEQIVGSQRMLFLDPLHPGIRQAAAPFLAEAVERFPQLAPLVAARTEQVQAAGYHAQVHLEPETSFFFLLHDGERLPLRSRNGQLQGARQSFSLQALASRAAEISPNALLRPVLQDYLLPTACLVGGPAEIAYLAQSAPLYDALLERQPVFLPRSGFTLFDAHAARKAAGYKLKMPEFFMPEVDFRERLARTCIPTELLGHMENASSRAAQLFDELRRELLRFDPTLASASERSQSRVLYQFQRLERKTAREIARREQRVQEDTEYLRGLVYPHKHLQERLYSILPFLAAHGAGLIEAIGSQIHESCPDHHVVSLS
jgi:bacillithiol synthase